MNEATSEYKTMTSVQRFVKMIETRDKEKKCSFKAVSSNSS